MSIAENIRYIEESIAEAVSRAGRQKNSVRLMGVSKFFSREAVDEARLAGLKLFGESRVQEAAVKFYNRNDDIELHFIGSLQRNKAKKAVEIFDGIDSVDRLELIECLGGLTASRRKPFNVLLEVNSGEEQKGGFRSYDELRRAAELVLGFNGLKLCGIMTIAPLSDNDAAARTAFRSLFKTKEKLAAEFGEDYFFELSMGMSGDYKIAIEEGATLVRIGTAIFGERT